MTKQSKKPTPDSTEVSVEELEARVASADCTGERNREIVTLMHRIMYAESQRAVALGREILEEVRSGDDRLLYARLLEYLGIAVAHQHQYDESTVCFTEARQLFEELGIPLQVMLMTTNLGNVESFRGNFDRALEYYSASLRMAHDIGNDRHRVTLLGNLGYLHLHRDNFLEAERYLSEGVELAEQVGHELGTANLLHNRGLLRYEKGEWREGLVDLYRSLEIYERMERLSDVAAVCGSIASSMVEAGDFEGAVEQYRRSLELSQNIGDRRGVALTLNNLGVLYRDFRRLDEAHDYFRESLTIKEGLGNPFEIATGLINMGDVCADLGRKEEAYELYSRVVDLVGAADDRRNRALALLGMGRMQREAGEFSPALESIEAAVDQFHELGLPRDIVTSLIEKGRLLHCDGRVEEAHLMFEEACRTAGVHELLREKVDALEELSRVNESMGEYQAALAYHREFEALRSQLRSEESERRYLRFSVIHEVDRQKQMRRVAEKESEILRLEKERLEAEGEHRKKELVATALFLTQKSDLLRRLRHEIGDLRRKVPDSLKGELAQILSGIDSSIDIHESWQLFEEQFRLVHADFIETIADRAPDLSPSELKVCALVKIGLTTKEAARILNIEPRSVETYRGRIRKKLRLKGGDNLQIYLTGL